MKQRTYLMNVSASGLVSLTCLLSMPAYAHIDMLGALQSRGGDQKEVPCDGSRSSGTVYTFEPGATITLGIMESLPHPSYFRIAFDNDGEDNFVEPASIKPIEQSRACPLDTNDKCGASDFCNVKSTTGGATVLWDNLDPHTADASKGSYSWTIRLPNVECANCTLQVIQVMEDTVHGAYCPVGACATECSSIIPGVSLCSDGSAQDIYHRCVNIVLKRGAGNTPGTASGPGPSSGIDCTMGQAADAGVPSGDASVASDASVQNDAGTTGGIAGGTPGGVTPGGGTTGGSLPGAAGGVGGVAAGTAGGTGTAGGAAGTTGGSAGTVGGGSTTGGGVPGVAGGGTSAGTGSPSDETPNDDGCDCAVSNTSPRYGNMVSMSLLALGLLARRRRLQR